MRFFGWLTMVLLVLSSCGTEEVQIDGPVTFTPPQPTESAYLRHARFFQVDTAEGHRIVTIINPWEGPEFLGRYMLVDKNEDFQPQGDFEVIKVPVSRVTIMSTTHAGCLLELNLEDRIIAADETDYYYADRMRELVANEQIKEVGGLSNLNLELLLDLESDLVVLSAMQGSATEAALLKNAGVPYVLNIDWQETTPLARAEWIKFMALFFGEEEKATAIFNEIEVAYNQLAELEKTVDSTHRVIMGSAFKGTWHMPAGQSFAAQFLEDAGATYDWSAEEGTGSIPLSFEAVLDRSQQAPLWLNPSSASSLTGLAEANSGYTHFKAFQDKNVYNNNARMNATGGNDYWESGTVRPDKVLADLVYILHPELLPDHQLFYYQLLPE